jgi:hypothetical protein
LAVKIITAFRGNVKSFLSLGGLILDKFAESKNKVDFVFSLYPLWITYSGLPQKLGVTAWCVYKRLLELRYRFGSTKFFYPLERLCATTGISKTDNVKYNLNKLLEAGLIKFTTSQGRGKASEFEIVEPINAPLSEEDVFRLHPRLQSKSYKKNLIENGTRENPPEKGVLKSKKTPEQGVLARENPPEQGAIKKDLYKKDNNNKNDLSHDVVDRQNSVDRNQTYVESAVVAVLNIESLKEYGVAGEQAARCLKRYSPHYLLEKIEIIEHKRYCGEQIRNIGGMLMKAIEEDWQPPEGFSTRTQRDEAARRERETKELEAREAKERAEQEKRSRENAAAAEEWKKTAPAELMRELHERARQAVCAEHPDTEEKLLRVPIRLRENRIIAEEYLEMVKRE